MKYIKLTKKERAIVDDDMFEYLNQWKWYCHGNKYAARKIGKRGKNIYMHRLILNFPENLEVDHINRNGLDNRKENLRIVTHQQNMMNQKNRDNSKSGYKHINWDKQTNRWRVIIYLGSYSKIEDAILVLNNYDYKRQ
jgi:hypothetical protein